MSRIGKKPITIPENTDVSVAEGLVTVKGPKGELSLAYKPVIDIVVEDGEVKVTPRGDSVAHRSLWGTYTSEIGSMILGVNTPFEKKLIVEGVGFRVELQGSKLVLSVGFSHTIELEVPEGVDCIVEKNTITISGVNKEKVGQFAAVIRAKKKPEPYKGKGIRYHDEVIRRKEGKKAS
jgi:large subunit ribosomal protein L6